MTGKHIDSVTEEIRFIDIPVGAWFIHTSDKRDAAWTPYLKISASAAYSPTVKQIFDHPSYFPPDFTGYLVVRIAQAPVWSFA